MTARTKTPPSPNEAPRDLTLHSDHVFTTDIRWLEGEVGGAFISSSMPRHITQDCAPRPAARQNKLSTHFVNKVGKASALNSPEPRASQTRYQIQQGYNVLATTGLLPSPTPDLKRCVAALGHSFQPKANPKRLVRNSQIDEGDADAYAEGEPEEDGADYWTLGPNGLIPINGAAPGPLGVVDHEWLKKYVQNPPNKQRGLLNGYKAALLETESIGNRFIRKGHPCEMIDPQALNVRKWRHELQKIYLSGVLPNSEEMVQADIRFTAIENFSGMNIGYLVFSKLAKVSRWIYRLKPDQVPKDEYYNFRGRANALVQKWRTQYQDCV
ncbi:hypothetical protein B0H14DRAFT_2593926 [Mycena olivaceomarginata]|nr:hypothetical protein B0H14DRAFT_2593926 [Mycena olivaceomarginata]